MSDLKPCPFCGGDANAIPSEHADDCYFMVMRNVKLNKDSADCSFVFEAIEAWNRRAQPAQAVPLLSDAEIQVAWVEHGLDDCAVEDFARAIEQEVRAKMGVAVPKRVHKANGGGVVHPALLSTDEWFEFWHNCDNVDGESVFPEFLCLAQDIEQLVLAKVGIVGKEGGK